MLIVKKSQASLQSAFYSYNLIFTFLPLVCSFCILIAAHNHPIHKHYFSLQSNTSTASNNLFFIPNGLNCTISSKVPYASETSLPTLSYLRRLPYRHFSSSILSQSSPPLPSQLPTVSFFGDIPSDSLLLQFVRTTGNTD